LQFPGVSNAWTMPIKARIDMLSTGIRTPVGVKVFGKDLAEIEGLSRQIEAVIRKVPGTTSAYAERVIGGYYLNVDPDRIQLARGPSSIRTENAQLTGYIYVDFRDRDLGGYVADAQKAVATQIKFPPGYYVTWSGQFEYLERAKARLQTVVPFTVLIIFLLLY